MALRPAAWPLLGLLALLPPSPRSPRPDAAPDAFDRVARALRARLHQTYVARQEIRFAAPGPAGWTRIVVDVARDGARSRLDYRSPASVADLLVTDDGFSRRQFQPACRLYQIRRSSRTEEEAGDEVLALLHRNYRCVQQGRRRVNGRDCDLLSLTPRRAPGPSRLCWMDRATDAILRTEEFDAQGRRRYVSAFTTLRFAARLPDALFCPAPPAGMTLQAAPPPPADLPYPQARAASGVGGCPPDWAPARLPPAPVRLPAPPARGARPAAALRGRAGDAERLRGGADGRPAAAGAPAADARRPVGALRPAGLGAGRRRSARHRGRRRCAAGLAGVGPAARPQPGRRAASARALARDFGPAAAAEAETLRRQGWGYDAIAAHLLSRGDPDRREDQARAWVAAALASDVSCQMT